MNRSQTDTMYKLVYAHAVTLLEALISTIYRNRLLQQNRPIATFPQQKHRLSAIHKPTVKTISRNHRHSTGSEAQKRPLPFNAEPPLHFEKKSTHQNTGQNTKSQANQSEQPSPYPWISAVPVLTQAKGAMIGRRRITPETTAI